MGFKMFSGLRPNKVRTICLLFLLFSHSAYAIQDKSPWSYNARLTLGSDDNLTQAQRSRDKAEDTSVEVGVSTAYSRLINNKQGYTFVIFGTYKAQNKFDNFNTGKIGGSAVYRFQPVLGFTQPFYKASATVKAEELKFDQRDSTIYEYRLSATKRITDRLTANLGIGHDERDSDGTVFDQKRNRAFLGFDLRLNNKSLIYTNYNYIDGDTNSTIFTGVVDSSLFGVIAASEARERDQAISDHAGGIWMAYKVDAKTNTYTLGYNRAIGSGMAVDLSALYVDVETEGNGEYQRLITRLSLLMRF